LSLFQDNGWQPTIAYEARELQIAVGMVAAQEGVCIVPISVHQSRTDDVRYLEIAEPLSSPIIMSHRLGDTTPELALMGAVIERTYHEWGYAVPDAVAELGAASAASFDLAV
jgi:DNA-binding transcriptional LysR family regulator